MAQKKELSVPTDESLAKATKDAMRLLSFRARSTQELRQRLQRKKYEETVIEAVLQVCAKQGFLDDEKFAKLYALSRLQSRPSGRRQIEFDLKNKGVSPGVVSRALGDLEDFNERKMALDLALRRQRSLSGLPENTAKTRLYGFLKRRGFNGDAVSYALSQLFKQADPFE
jgi:regulatory protein